MDRAVTPRLARRVLAGITASTLVVAACSGSDDAATGPEPAADLQVAGAESDPVDDGAVTDTDAASGDGVVATDEPAPTGDAPAVDQATVPELLRFSSPLVGGGDFDAASTAGTPTAFWFWSPT